MKKFFTLLAALLMLSASAETLSLYDGTEWSNKAPFNGMYFDTAGNKTQVLYPAADLTAMVGKQITGITFYTDENGCPIDGGLLNISLGETDATVMTGYITEGMTQVGTLTFTKSERQEVEIVITFDTPYTYNGGNLIFENVVAETTGYDNLYCVGVSTSYDNCVVTDFGTSMRKFLPKVTFTYGEEGGQEEGLTLLAEANALEDNSEFTFDGDAVVTAFFNGNLFLRDESGYGMIPSVVGDFGNGEVLSQGWNATKTSNDGWVKYINAAGLSASGETNAELAAAQKLTGAVDESMLNAYVYIENVNLGPFPPRSFKLPDGSTILKSEILGGINWSSGGNYNVYGIIVKDGGVLKLNAIDSEVYHEPEPEFLRGDVNRDGDVNIADVTTLIDMLLSNAEMIPEADCYIDNDMNIADVTALIDYLLSGQW